MAVNGAKGVAMAGKPVRVRPDALLSAASTVAAHLERSAAPAPVALAVTTGSPVDAAAGSAAVGVQTKMSALSAQLTAKSSALQGSTAAGTAGLETQDGRNAATLAVVRATDMGRSLAANGVQLMSAGTEAPPPCTPAAPPKIPLDLSAIQRLAPGAPGPYGYTELVPGSGVWVPDPAVNALHPGTVGPTAKAPLDLADIVRRAPGALGPPGHMELVPGSGVWVPDPGSPGFVPRPPRFPLDVAGIVRLAPGALGPHGFMELVPHSGVWVPDPGGPH
jgi:hypothetical protein